MRRRDFIKSIAGSTVVRPLAAGAAQNAAFITIVPGKLTVCTYAGFAPVCYKNAAGHLVGYDVSFLTKFAVKEGREIVLIEKEFEEIWTLPGKDVCDIAAAGVMQRNERNVGTGAWSDPYFEVKRSLLVRAGEKAEFDNYKTLSGKTIVVTKGSTAYTDAVTLKRYPRCTIQYREDLVPKNAPDAQEYIVKLIANHKVDAFGEGDVSSKYLRDQYGKDVPGGLALADVHDMDGPKETFNFITRNPTYGVLDSLNVFIIGNKGSYELGS
jgi:ABC-type amino acid transport substrate-binding protein